MFWHLMPVLSVVLTQQKSAWLLFILAQAVKKWGHPLTRIEVFKFVGNRVSAGEPLAKLHVNNDARLKEAESTLLEAYEVGEKRRKPRKLILGIVT